MRRKILMGVVALALPLSMLAGLSTSASAKKAPLVPDPGFTCGVSGTVVFQAPGLSLSGTTSATLKVSTTVASASFACGGSTPLSVNINSKNTKCKGVNLPAAPCMVKKTYSYDSEAGFASTGTSSIQKSLKKLTFTVNGHTYQTKTSVANDLACTSNSPPGGPGGDPQEVGFSVVGTVKSPKNDKGETTTLNACLGVDNGPGTSGSFFDDLESGIGTIAGTTIDGSTSTLTVS